jgi:ABC-type branched-subunit amino acid transport system substrate-binding protein
MLTVGFKVGLSPAFSGPNAAAGQAMQRGAELAMDEINKGGGILGRQLARSSATMSTSSIAAWPRCAS